MRIFDSHAHYTDAQYDHDRDAVLAAQFKAGVSRILEVACEPASFDKALKLCARHKGIYAALGVHPHNAGQADADTLAALQHLLSTQEKAVAFGEIGLDYHYDFYPRNVQRDAFDCQLSLARALNLPVVLHVRKAYEDALDILKAHGQGLCGVMHCFSGTARIARQCVDMGLYVAFGGAITFRNAQDALESAAAVPLDRLLIETDCPYMAPVPHRGKRNESRLLTLVIEKLAALHGVPDETLAAFTYQNACALFDIPG